MSSKLDYRVVDQNGSGRIDELLYDGGGEDLFITAPHGGGIEPYTDCQAHALADERPQSTLWVCTGLSSNAAFADRHVPSTAISESEFKLLSMISDRGFESAVSFHGMRYDGVRVGGRSPQRDDVRDAISSHLPDDIPVTVAGDDEKLAGTHPENIVNRYAINGGLQIEQSMTVRQHHWETVVNVLADVV